MFNALSNLFGRAFIIAFLLPSIYLNSVILAIFYIFVGGKIFLLNTQFDTNIEKGIVLLFLIWFVAIAILALNRPIIRFKAGYARWNPIRILLVIRKREFLALQRKIAAGNKAWDDAEARGEQPSEAILTALAEAKSTMVRDFPHKIELLLPTKLGNRLRAFEVYSLVVYGLNSSVGWSRLLSVVPSDFLKIVEDEKAQMDFWINIWLGGWLGLIFYVYMCVYSKDILHLWVLPIIMLISWSSSESASAAAVRFGILTTSAFDLFRLKLCEQLNMKVPESFEDERKMWELLSQVWIYGSAKTADKLTPYRKVENKAEIPASDENGSHPTSV